MHQSAEKTPERQQGWPRPWAKGTKLGDWPDRDDQRRQPSWNASTMTIQTLHAAMRAQGWGGGGVPEIPASSESAAALPRRPLDFGAGLWR